MSGRAEGERKEGDDTWGRRSAGGERADLRARLVSQGEGMLAGRRGLLRCAGSGQLGRGVLAGLESAACERPVGGVQWKGRSDARGREEKRAVAGRAGDGASWAAVLGRRERKEGKMAWASLG